MALKEIFFVKSDSQARRERLNSSMIIETTRISDILKHIGTSTAKPTDHILLIFDLDETVIRVLEPEATGEWFLREHERLMKQGKTAEDAKTLLLPKHITAYHKTKVEVMDRSIYAIFKAIYSQNIKFMALTAREGHALAEPTFRQLRDIHLFFGQETDSCWHTTLLFPEIPERDTLFSQGILFTGGTDKGELLNLFLKKVEYAPTKIVFVDDSLKNVQSVQTFAKKNNMTFVGLHYTKAQYTTRLTSKSSQGQSKSGV